ncbi:MAG: hypothetical protein GYB35_14795 [Algicola sp.]|nr:hypothetical protein [Algicola sp.]
MSNSHEVNWDRKNGQNYLKDVNQFMDDYEGTWKYVNGTTEFRITLNKVEMYHVQDSDYNIDYYTDGLLVSYQKLENDNVVFQSFLDQQPHGIIKEFGKLSLTFKDYERTYINEVLNVSRNAGHKALLQLIENESGSYQLHFKLFTEKTYLGTLYEPVMSGNPYHSTPTDIIMTKME